jgi:hypothetical protein
MVSFPFPDEAQRAEIWRRVFPALAPINGLDALRLARLEIAGGTIRNIAVNAAFLAAAEGTTIAPAHLARAVRREFIKLERPIPEEDLRRLLA